MDKKEEVICALNNIGEEARKILAAKDEAREEALKLAREVTRNSSLAIRAIHRRKRESASSLLEASREHLAQLHERLSDFPDLLFAGFVQDAEKEFSEASLTYALIYESRIPSPQELGVGIPPYLNGLGEAAGELRRYILDSMLRGEEGCRELFEIMEEIHAVLATMDFPDAITGGLRRTADLVRSLAEKTREDLLLFLSQKELSERLKQFREHLEGGAP